MWKEYLNKVKRKCELTDPVTVDRLVAAESALAIELPGELRDLLLESDGIRGKYGEGIIWPAERIVEGNLAFRGNEDFRDLYMPFDHLLFFADAGDGNQFAYPIQADNIIHRLDVFAWTHEDDARVWVAPSLKTYLERSISGKIKL